MLQYILRRLLIAVPILFLVSVIVFLAGQQLQDDPFANKDAQPFTGSTNDPEAEAIYWANQAKILHIHSPNFYFNIALNCLPDTFYKVQPVWRKRVMRQMALQCGEWQPVADYQHALAQSIRVIEALPDSLVQRTLANKTISLLKTATSAHVADTLLHALQKTVIAPASLAAETAELKRLLQNTNPKPGWGYPVFHWYGSQNQYHHWLTGQYSSENHSPWKILQYPLRVTLVIKFTAILLSFLIAIPLGLFLGTHERWDKVSKRVLMLFYIVPVLLIGCGLRYLFATPGYGFFSTYIGGIGTSVYNPETDHFWRWIVANQGRLLLPIVTVGLHTMAFTALQMRSGVLAVARQDFIRTARAKGLPQRMIVWRHILGNALFPIIVIFGSIFPSVLGGTILVELIFNIYGIGSVTYEAVLDQNYPVLMTVVMLAAALTILGSLVADILMAWVDPRVRMK